MGPEIETPVLSILNEVVIVEVLNKESRVETEVGNCRFEGLKQFTKYSGSTKRHDLDGLRDCLLKCQS